MAGFDLQNRLMMLIPLVLSLSVHEWAHAWSAWKLGDDTASQAGRLTLNPLAHIDPVGTFLLPLMGVPFGWARPVPVNPARFRKGVSMSAGMAITAAAGPISNLLQAVLAVVIWAGLGRFAPGLLAEEIGVSALLRILILLNVNLALFNLIPVPPLDGSRIVDGLMPYRLRPVWERLMVLAPFLLIAVFFFGGRLISGPAQYVLKLLSHLAIALSA